MLLSELDPGTMFRLTKDSLKAERERMRVMFGSIDGERAADRVQLGPYTISMPQRETSYNSTGRVLTPAELEGCGGWFQPSKDMQYEVEVIPPTPGEGTAFPSRVWLNTSTDPEVFLERDGQIVPGFSVLPSKKQPAYAEGGGGVYHEDGFQAEFSPMAVACHETVVYSMHHAMISMVQCANRGAPGVRISDANFVELSPEVLAMGTDDQVALGCDTSENVWDHPRFAIDNAREFPFRMAGGHIHLGMPQEAKWFHRRAERIIKAMDVFLGVPSVALLAGLDDPRRRRFYGRAGEFRFQKHGLEYRVLSNAYLQHPALTHLVLNMARGAFRFGTSNWEGLFKYDPELVRHIINDYDVKAAQKFVEDNAKLLIWIMNRDSGRGWGAKALSTIHAGAKSTFGDSLGIMRNWVSPGPIEPQTCYSFMATHSIKNWGDVPEEPRTPVPLFTTRRIRNDDPPARAPFANLDVPSLGRTAGENAAMGHAGIGAAQSVDRAERDYREGFSLRMQAERAQLDNFYNALSGATPAPPVTVDARGWTDFADNVWLDEDIIPQQPIEL